jgi:hypothetical protein
MLFCVDLISCVHLPVSQCPDFYFTFAVFFCVAQFCYLCNILPQVKFKFHTHIWWVCSLFNFTDFGFSCSSKPSISPHYPSGF